MTTRGVTLAALLDVLGRPAWWVLALAGFLVRGGILLFLVAVVTLPSPLAISNVVAPLLVPIVFGGLTPALMLLIALGIGSAVAWVLVGALIGSSTEVVLIADARRTATDEGLFTRHDRGVARWVIARVTAARLIAHVPFVVAVALGSVQVVNVAYLELTTPSDVTTALPLRIISGAVGPLVVTVVALVIGEITGGLAARRISLGGGSIVGSVSHAYADLLSRPRSTLFPAVLTTAILAVDLAAMLAVIGLTWTAARSQLMEIPLEPLAIGLAIAAFTAAWFLALFVTGLIDAWRSVAMTYEEERAASFAEWRAGAMAATSGTFGASPADPTG